MRSSNKYGVLRTENCQAITRHGDCFFPDATVRLKIPNRFASVAIADKTLGSYCCLATAQQFTFLLRLKSRTPEQSISERSDSSDISFLPFPPFPFPLSVLMALRSQSSMRTAMAPAASAMGVPLFRRYGSSFGGGGKIVARTGQTVALSSLLSGTF